MSFLFPRFITVTRPDTPATATVGNVGFSGADPINETVIVSDLPAQIAYQRVGTANPTGLPTDSRSSQWMICIPRRLSVPGQITEDDIITDDLGKRYQVYAAYLTSLGWQIYCQLLNA